MSRHEGKDIYSFNYFADAAIPANRFVILQPSSLARPKVALCVTVPPSRQDVGITVEAFDPADANTHGGIFGGQNAGVGLRMLGTALVEAAGPIQAGSRINPDAQGRAVAAATGLWTAEGRASAAGELVMVKINGI